MSEPVRAIREAAYGEGFDAAVAASNEARDILRERIAELEEALRPFSDFNTQGCWEHTAWKGKPDTTPVLHNHVTGLEISIGDFHNATRAMRAR